MADPAVTSGAGDGAALLADLTSRDATRIWSSSSAVLGCWDAAVLGLLAAHVDDIEQATAGVELGGALVTDAARLRQALDRLRHHRDGRGCLCGLYPSWLLHDPEREAAAGHVRLDAELDDWGGWRVTCTTCGTSWDVERRESHHAWWAWTRARPETSTLTSTQTSPEEPR